MKANPIIEEKAAICPPCMAVELPKMVSLGDQSYNRIWCLRDWMR